MSWSKGRILLLGPLGIQGVGLSIALRKHGISASSVLLMFSLLLTSIALIRWEAVEHDLRLVLRILWESNLRFFSKVALLAMYVTGVIPFGLFAKATGRIQIDSSFRKCKKRETMFAPCPKLPARDFLRQS